MEREGVDFLRNYATFQEFPMAGNHHPPPDAAFFPAAANHYIQSDTVNHHPQPNSNSTFWGNQLSAAAFVPASVNHHQHSNDFLAGNQLNSGNLAMAMMNGSTVQINPRYTDALLESEFARLSLMPAVRTPAFVDYGGSRTSGGRNYSIFNEGGSSGASFAQLRDADMRQMRIESAARGQMGLYMNMKSDLEVCGRNLKGGYRYDLGANYRWGCRQSLKELRGKILSVARDQHGCRFLQSKFEEGTPEEIQMIFMEVKEHICELMVDQFGNYLVQKFVGSCNHEQMTQLLVEVVSDEHRFMDICIDAHGSRCVQRLLECLTTPDQRSRLISVLRRITLPLTKSMNGHHVIQYFLKSYTVEEKKHILNVVADHCMEIATDKSGCCVLQQCVEHAVGEPRDRLISQITSNALMLSEHPYGNYVVQYILGLRIPQATTNIIAQLSGNIVSLSMSKYGSNVVEKFLKDPEITQETQVHPIIEELIYSPHFLRVLQDPFGNYVAQSAFAASKGGLRSAMISLIQANNPNLHSHPHGKRVLQCIKGNRIRV